jgi:hypothetical protein
VIFATGDLLSCGSDQLLGGSVEVDPGDVDSGDSVGDPVGDVDGVVVGVDVAVGLVDGLPVGRVGFVVPVVVGGSGKLGRVTVVGDVICACVVAMSDAVTSTTLCRS